MWNRKRIGYTAVSAIVAVALLALLSKVLSADGIGIPTQLTCLVFVGVAFGGMIVGLGEAAAMEEKRRQREEQERAKAVQAAAPAVCDLCANPQLFVRCIEHRLSLCWGCYQHHDPFDTHEMRPIPNARERAEARA